MLESLTSFQDMRSNPHVMIYGKAAQFFNKKKEFVDEDTVQTAQNLKPAMSPEELKVLDKLKLRDTAVRDEEETHARMLGRHAGAIKYEYQIGPDGRAYVINGSIEVSPKFNSTDPDDIRKVLQTIKRAAVTVSNPSQADLNIAANAANRVSNVDWHEAMTKYSENIESQFATPEEASLFDSKFNHQLDTTA